MIHVLTTSKFFTILSVLFTGYFSINFYCRKTMSNKHTQTENSQTPMPMPMPEEPIISNDYHKIEKPTTLNKKKSSYFAWK
jgi:hypothetical protein